jgi:predicted RNase H-like HicB family nuclease
VKKYHYSVVIEKDEDGIFIASCPTFPGCHTQGETYDEVMQNIKEAIELNIEARKQLNEPIPIESVVDEIEVYG